METMCNKILRALNVIANTTDIIMAVFIWQYVGRLVMTIEKYFPTVWHLFFSLTGDWDYNIPKY